ncbi:metallophosphoesterase family protein [Planctomycetota bacterium]
MLKTAKILIFFLFTLLSLTGCTKDKDAKSVGELKEIRFGLCADVHMGVIHNAEERMQTFVDRMNKEKVDFIMQLGDFCSPYPDDKIELAPKNARFLAIFNQFKGPKYHVFGNHDIDDNFTWEETMAFWEVDRTYYSFDMNGWHFVVLDGNNKKDDPAPGYPRYIGPEQRQWLEEDLAKTNAPTFIFSHQSLEDEEGVENTDQMQAILEEANRKAGFGKVVACFCGHHHRDYHTIINGIYYIDINSMSYQWLGGDYIYKRFSDEVEEAYPFVQYTAPYKDALYAIVTVLPQGGIKIEGVKSEYIPPGPATLGYPEAEEGKKGSADISDRQLNFKL